MRLAAAASKSNKCDAQHGCAYKVAEYSFGKSHIDKFIRLVFLISTLESFVYNEYIQHMKFTIHISHISVHTHVK